jgi:histidinol phosphatase-like PHP family hydrolase
MIDLHTHTVFSDGELIPSELVRRAEVIGCRAIALTDHVDHSNIDFVVPRLVDVSRVLSRSTGVEVIPGLEITHVPVDEISSLCESGRELGAAIVVVHGETIVEPVPPGTNKKAIECSVDILAHPGLITEDEVVLAGERGVLLEITTRKGHSLSNGHVAQLALRRGAKLILNTDAHGPQDLLTEEARVKVARGAGLNMDQVARALQNAERLVARCKGEWV